MIRNTIKSGAVIAALRKISDSCGGIINPDAVVSAAKAENSPLHKYFTWEDNEAAHQWRLHEARMMLRVVVQYIGKDEDPVRVFVSLKNDRTEEGGYRVVADVLNDKDLYKQLLNDALEDLDVFTRKYERLKELRGIFREAKQLNRIIKSRAK